MVNCKGPSGEVNEPALDEDKIQLDTMAMPPKASPSLHPHMKPYCGTRIRKAFWYCIL